MTEEARRTILCVDDEEDVASSLYDTFMDSYDVKTANSGEEALKIFNQEDISLVISDQRMPEMEGSELLAKINEIKPICKKILLTGYADINAAIDSINKGSVDKYFSKPWDDDELSNAVKDLLSEYSMDLFFDKAIEETKSIKEDLSRTKEKSGLFENFMDNYLTGICLLGTENKISFVNKRGLEIIKYKNLNEIAGTPYNDVFSITEIQKKRFLEKYIKKDISLDKLETHLADGTSCDLKGGLIFTQEDSGIEVSGLIFNKS